MRVLVPVLMMVLGLGSRLLAQDSRNDQIRAATRAYQNFETARALQLLNTALDPSRGPADSVWGQGVQLLAQILIEDGKATPARAWLRWAFRLAPDLKIDTLNFTPDVVAAARVARDAVRGMPGDQLTETSWQWAGPRGDTLGRLQINPSILMSAPITVLVPGRGLIRTGESVVLPPGSYELQAAAAGYLTARVTREVLPGVATVLTFNLTSLAPPPDTSARVMPAPATPAAPQPTPAGGQLPTGRKKGGMPTWVKLGIAGGVAWALAWNLYIKSH
jgi:hypothetical protein